MNKYQTIIKPRRGISLSRALQVIEFRNLIMMLAFRDIRIRYKQSILGFAWALVRPVAQMVVFSVFFGWLLGVDQMIGDTPYPIFVYAALLPWTLFSSSVTSVSNSLLSNNSILSKVYVPRLVFPFSTLGVPVVDYLIALSILVAMMIWYGTMISWMLVLVIPLTLLTILIALGIGMIISSLGVWYRDFLFTVGFMLQIWQFLSPVMYPLDRFPEHLRWVVALNPMYGVIEAYRSSILNTPMNLGLISISLVTGVALLAMGMLIFLSMEKRFVDRI